MNWRWKVAESHKTPDQWYIYARPKWCPFWFVQDVRTGLKRAVEHMACLMANSGPQN